jgi:hypothetical protein
VPKRAAKTLLFQRKFQTAGKTDVRSFRGDESDAPQITTAEDWHVGFAPGPRDNPDETPRRKPDQATALLEHCAIFARGLAML